MWPIGPDPFITTDTYSYYRSLAKPRRPARLPQRLRATHELRDRHSGHGILRQLSYRFIWMFVGPMAAIVSALMIMTEGTGWLTKFDLLFLVAILITVGARWGGSMSGDGTEGGPAAIGPIMQRFLSRVIPMALALWLITNVVGNHLLR